MPFNMTLRPSDLELASEWEVGKLLSYAKYEVYNNKSVLKCVFIRINSV